MKQQLDICNEKLAEEGCSPEKCDETKRRISGREQLIQCLKLVLYVELILLFGWGGYTMFQYHRDRAAEAKVEVADVKRPLGLFEREPLEASTNPSVVLGKQWEDIELLLNRLNNFEEESNGPVGSLDTVLDTTQVSESKIDVRTDASPEITEDESQSTPSEIGSMDSSSDSYEDTSDDFSDWGGREDVISINLPFFGMIHGLFGEAEFEESSEENSQSADASVVEETPPAVFSVPAVEVSVAVPETDVETELRKDEEVQMRSLLIPFLMRKSESSVSNESETEFDSEQDTEESFNSEMDSVGNTRFTAENLNTDPSEELFSLSGDSGTAKIQLSLEDFPEEEGLTTTSNTAESLFERESDSKEKNPREDPSFDSNVGVKVEDASLATAQSRRTDQDERSMEEQRNEKISLDLSEAEIFERMGESMSAEDLLATDLCTRFLRLMVEHVGESKLFDFQGTIAKKHDVFNRCWVYSRRLTRSVDSQNENNDVAKAMEQELHRWKQSLLRSGIRTDDVELKNKITRFLQKMHLISANIDRSQMRPVINSLDDGYVSKEMPVEIPVK